MKTLYTFFLLLWTSTILQAQFSLDASYNLALPQGKMANNINGIHQFRLGSTYKLPKALKMINVGAEIGIGNYANLRMPTTFNFGNGNPATTYVNYSSNTFQANAVVSIDLVKNFLVTPYIIMKGGYQNWFSNIYVEDPNDLDGCKPLEKKSILKDHTTTLSYGGGLKYELNKKSSNRCGDFKSYIDLQVTTVRGGSLDYINTKKLAQHDNTATTPTVVGDGGKPVELKFINVQSNVIHSHMVAEMYTTPLRLLEIKLGYHVQF
jgi:hypothetical protein